MKRLSKFQKQTHSEKLLLGAFKWAINADFLGKSNIDFNIEEQFLLNCTILYIVTTWQIFIKFWDGSCPSFKHFAQFGVDLTQLHQVHKKLIYWSIPEKIQIGRVEDMEFPEVSKKWNVELIKKEVEFPRGWPRKIMWNFQGCLCFWHRKFQGF